MRFRLILIYMVTMAVLFLNCTEAYSDLKAQVWSDFKGSFAEESIIRLAGHGIVSGSPGEFSPEDKISRIQFAVLIARVLGIQPVFPSNSSFSDIPRGTLEAGYIEAMTGLHIVFGSGGERFEPEGPILRQDAAVLLHRALGGGAGRLSLTEGYIDSGHFSPYAALQATEKRPSTWPGRRYFQRILRRIY